MSGQLSLDSLGGIDWEHPRLEQLEQFALDYLPGCKTRWESHGGHMSVLVEWDVEAAWLRPSLERTADDRLEWLARLEHFTPSCERSVAIRSDEELESWLWNLFVGGCCE